MRFTGMEVQAWSHDGQQLSLEVCFLARPPAYSRCRPGTAVHLDRAYVS